jgi:hypothetical protein
MVVLLSRLCDFLSHVFDLINDCLIDIANSINAISQVLYDRHNQECKEKDRIKQNGLYRCDTCRCQGTKICQACDKFYSKYIKQEPQ